jgi:ATP-dependent protease HslVU (ClpYQ) peptidase subunit
MSLIIAYKKDDVIYLASDSQSTSSNYDKYTSTNPEFAKLTMLDNGIIVGRTGRMSYNQQIVYSGAITLDDNGELTREHLVLNVIPKLLKIKKEWINDNGARDNSDVSSTLVLAHKDKLFLVECDLLTYTVEHMALIGSGGGYAFASVAAIDPESPIEPQLVAALKIATKYTASVGGPFIMVNTKDATFKTVI